MRKVIYSVNLGGYDAPLAITKKSKGFDYVMLTDDKGSVGDGWKAVIVDLSPDVHRQSRELKINAHKYLPDYDVYVYLDANYRHTGDVGLYVDQHFKGGMFLHIHNTRKCVFQEAAKVKALNYEVHEVVDAQMREYAMRGMPRNYGLFQGGFFIRDRSVDLFCEAWAAEVVKWSYRDQLSLPYMLFVHKPKLTVMQSILMRRVVNLVPHNGAKKMPLRPVVEGRPPRVWHFTPGRGDKNLGQAYNDHCEAVPDGDWICIRDGDTMFLHPFWSKQIEDIALRWSGGFPLISCYTNRLGLRWQLPYGFSENTDVRHHMGIAYKHYDNHYSDVIVSPGTVAGLFMLFPKSTWNAVKFEQGLVRGGKMVDWLFSEAVEKKLGKPGIATGIYLFHLYRLAAAKRTDITHLL